MGAVLHHFEHAAEASVLVAHGNIENVDEEIGLLDPEFGLVLLARTQFVNHFFHHMCALAGMAVHDFTPDDVAAAREHAVVGVGVEANKFVFVDEREVDGHVAVDEIDLLEGELAGGHIEFLVGTGRIAVFREQLCQIGGEAFGGCGRGSGFGGRLAMVDCDVQIGIADFVVAGFHLREFFFADHGAGCGIEDGFLLVHEVATVVD